MLWWCSKANGRSNIKLCNNTDRGMIAESHAMAVASSSIGNSNRKCSETARPLMFTLCCCLHGAKDSWLIVPFLPIFLTIVATPSLLLLPYLATAIAITAATALQQTVGWLSLSCLTEWHSSVHELSFCSCHCHTAWHGVQQKVIVAVFPCCYHIVFLSLLLHLHHNRYARWL